MEVIVVLAVIVAGVSGLLIGRGARNPAKISWSYIAATLSLFAVTWMIFAILAGLGGFGGVIAFALGVVFAGALLVTALALVIYLPGKRKFFALIPSVLFPLGVAVSIVLGNSFSPDTATRNHRDALVNALQRYHQNTGTYPQSLDQLVPQYLTEIEESRTMWGWLYLATPNRYSLGYVMGVDWDYFICFSTSHAPDWDCKPAIYTDFILPPTPGMETPTYSITITPRLATATPYGDP
jgi:hypothetical protein